MPNRENIESVFELAASQWGLFTAAQALEAGASRTQLSRMVTSKRIESASYGVYRLTDGEETPYCAIKAAWLSLFPKQTAYERLRARPYDAVVTGRTAACMHGSAELHESPYEFAIANNKRSARKDVVLRSWQVDESDVVSIQGLPVASVERTIADLIRGNEDPSLLGNFISGVCRRGHVIDGVRLAELLSPLASRNGYAKGDGAAFAQKLVSDYADAVQMRFATDSVVRALEASPSLRRIAETIKPLSSAVPEVSLSSVYQAPAIQALVQLQEALEPYRLLSDSITNAMHEVTQNHRLLFDAVGNIEVSSFAKALRQMPAMALQPNIAQTCEDGDATDELQDA